MVYLDVIFGPEMYLAYFLYFLPYIAAVVVVTALIFALYRRFLDKKKKREDEA